MKKILGRLTVIAGLALAFLSSPASAFPISSSPVFEDSSGRGWLDNYIGLSTSWLDFAEHCNSATGACFGEIETVFHGTFNLDGVYWASRDEVRDMLYEVTHLPQGALDNYQADSSSSFGAAANFFDYRRDEEGRNIERRFGSMHSDGGGRGAAIHILRDLQVQPGGELRAYSATINGCVGKEIPCIGNTADSTVGLDRFYLNGTIEISVADQQIGTFLYRRATAVPEAGTLTLLCMGLFGMGLSRRRHIA